MTTPARVLKAAGVGLVVVLALVMILAALRTDLPRNPGVMSDALGPENSEPIDDYLARAADSLVGGDGDDDDEFTTDPDAPRWALVSAERAWSVAEASGAVQGLPRVSGLYVQVPVDGVAMPVTGATLAEPVAGETGRDQVFDRGLEQVAGRLDGEPQSGADVPDPPDPDRAAAVNALTVSRIQGGEPAIIGLLARGTTEQLRALADQPRVRAVEALPPDAVWQRFAVRPLQPQQLDAAYPLPDDAPVPNR